VLKPGIHGVRTRWIRGFMAFRLVRRTRIVMLMVSACPESGFLGRAARAPPISPKLRLIWRVVSGLSWVFAVVGWCGSGYFKVSGIGVPMSLKACCWALVGSASMGTVAVVPVNRTWLRVSVARCSSRPRKLW